MQHLFSGQSNCFLHQGRFLPTMSSLALRGLESSTVLPGSISTLRHESNGNLHLSPDHDLANAGLCIAKDAPHCHSPDSFVPTPNKQVIISCLHSRGQSVLVLLTHGSGLYQFLVIPVAL